MAVPAPEPEDFLRALDPQGVFVYFGLHGQRFLLNGNTGFFRDSLADFAVQALDAMALPEPERLVAWEAVRTQHNEKGSRLVEQLAEVQAGTHSCLAPEPRMERLLTRGVPTTVTVYLSQACNQRCRYCYSQGGTFGGKPGTMSREIAQDVLAFLIHQAEESPDGIVTAILFGGEPLLAPEALRVIAGGAHAHNRHDPEHTIRLLLMTNGTLWDGEVFAVFAADPENYSICISLDADRTTHDTNRPFAETGGASAFDAALGTLRRLQKGGCFTSATCLVNFPFDFVGAAQSLRALGLSCFELKQPIFHVYGREGLPSVLSRPFEVWRENYLHYCDWYLDDLPELASCRFVDRVSTVRDCTRILQGDEGNTLACRVAEWKVSVTVNGTLMPCESFLGAPELALGDVKKGFDKQKFDSFERWLLSHGQHRIDRQSCRDCFAKRFCGGGCYAASFDRTRRLEPLLDAAACRYVREQTKIDLYFTSQLRRRHPEHWASCLGREIEVRS